jgi:hypothetical protein
MTTKKIVIGSIVAGVALGLFWGATMMYAAWQLNSQQEFHSGSHVEWLSWLSVGLSWFVVIAAPVSVLLMAVAFTGRAMGRRKGSGTP